MLSVDIAELAHSAHEGIGEPIPGIGARHSCARRRQTKNPNAMNFAAPLRANAERRGEQRGSTSDERPAVDHSITRSARCSSGGEMVRRRALTVLRLTTSSNFVGRSMGRSPGLAPLRILSTKTAARRYISGK